MSKVKIVRGRQTTVHGRLFSLDDAPGTNFEPQNLQTLNHLHFSESTATFINANNRRGVPEKIAEKSAEVLNEFGNVFNSIIGMHPPFLRGHSSRSSALKGHAKDVPTILT